MKSIIILVLFSLAFTSFLLGMDRISVKVFSTTDIDSNYIYLLPFEPGKCHLVVQANNSRLSHRNLKAMDFKMKQGSRICAARDGVVISVVESFSKGGMKRKYLRMGNHIGIRHSDGTNAYYWHLKHNEAFVNIGDTIVKGQVIGLSGNTGFSFFPHLHFEVRYRNESGRLIRLTTLFNTSKGIKYLHAGKFYKRARE